MRDEYEETSAADHESIHPPLGPPPDRLWDRRPVAEPKGLPASSPGRGRLGLMLAGSLVAIVALVLGLRSLVPQTPSFELELEGRIALLPMVNTTGQKENDWVTYGLVEMIAESLAHTPGLEIVPPKRLLKLFSDRDLDPIAEESGPRARELAWTLGADLLVETRLRHEGRRGESLVTSGEPSPLAFDIVLHPRQGASRQEEIEGSDPIDLANQLIVSLARSLNSKGEPSRIETTFSTSHFLDQLYGMGLHALVTRGPADARTYFTITVENRPYFLTAKLALAQCERQLGNLETSQTLTREILEEAQARGAQRLQAKTLAEQARIAAIEGNQDAASELFGQAGTLFARLGDDALRSEITFELARLALARNDRDVARKLFEDRLELQLRLTDRPGQIDSLMELASLALAEGALEEAEQSLAQAENLAREVGDPWTQKQVVASRGELARRQGDTESAIVHWSEALVFYHQQGDIPRQLLLSRKLSEAHLEERNYEAAEDLLHGSLEMAHDARQPAMEAAASLRLAWLLLRTGYPLQARSHVERALELDRWIVEDRLALQLVIAWLAYEQGNYRLALETQLEAKRQAGDGWRPLDEEFLKVFRRALERGSRLPVPGEDSGRTG